jgi:hypothetical protein
VSDKYLSFVEICKKDGTYVDKKCGLLFKVKKGEIFSRGRDERWELRFSPVNIPNKKRFLRYSDKQARQIS